MMSMGYTTFTNDFLIKRFNDITINITRNNEEVKAITGYNNNQEIEDIPTDILNKVKSDINNCNK